MTFHGKHDVSLGTDVSRKVQAPGRRRYTNHDPGLCCRCLVNPVRAAGQRYCRDCHNASALASYHHKQNELKRLKALEEKLKLSKGNEQNGESEDGGGVPAAPADAVQPGGHSGLHRDG